MLIYFIFAPSLYSRFVLNNGKNIQYDEKLPRETGRISYYFDNLEPVVIDGEELSSLWGWAFLQEEPDQSQYERIVVLKSDSRIYFFPTQSFQRSDVQAAFSDLGIDIQDSGFSTYISKEVIRPGSYRIGFVFKNQMTDEIFYSLSNNILVRTANQFQFESALEKP
jgi:hypothetical protein